MVDLTNEELFNSALNDEPIAEPVADETTEQASEQPRDEQGRFAAKTEEEKPVAKAEAKSDDPVEAQIPSWRLREIREERDQLRALVAQLQSQPRQQAPQPQQKPDLFEKPTEFVRGEAQELVAPVQTELAKMREEFSRMYAVDKHGEEKVSEAYGALDQAAKRGDPEAVAVVQRVKSSMTPFQDIMKWHEKHSVYTQIGSDPEAWFAKQLEAKLGDEKFKTELVAKLNPQSEKPKPVFNVPSLNRVAAAQAAIEESGDLTNESLFRHALG